MRGDSQQEKRPERDQHIQTREPARPGSLSHGPAERLRQAAANSRHDHTGDSMESDHRGSVTRGDLENSLCGTLLPVGEEGGIHI